EARVDADDAVLERLRDAPHTTDVAAVEIRGEPVRRVVRGANRLLLGREAREPCDGPEGLLAAHRHLGLHVHEHRRLEERVAETQVWPELRYLQSMVPATAASRSASSKTMNGALPPSSSEIFFSCFEHCSINSFPTSVEPVKPTLRTSGFDVSSPPITGASASSPVTMLKTPGGSPAASPTRATASAVSGVCSAGLSTIVLPAASAGAALRAGIAAGKFQGVIPALTPIGCFSTTTRRSCMYVGIVSP